ncbi:MAG: potassium channel family protein [Atopobiaceae bacterium]
MKNNILLIGAGYFGTRVAERLMEYKQDVMVVDIDEDRVNDCLDFVTNARIGDVTNEAFIESLGVNDYDVCIVAIGDDFMSSLQATALLKDHGARYVVSRASSDVQEKFLLRNGADKVIFPERSYADWTAIRYANNHVFDYLPLDDNFVVMEVEVPASWAGKTINDLQIRSEYGLNIIAIKHQNVMSANIDPLSELNAEDSLLVLGKTEDIRSCFKLQ